MVGVTSSRRRQERGSTPLRSVGLCGLAVVRGKMQVLMAGDVGAGSDCGHPSWHPKPGRRIAVAT